VPASLLAALWFRYQQIATAAYEVVCHQQQQLQQQQQQQQQQHHQQQQEQQGKPMVHPALVGAAAGPWPANISNSSSSSVSASGISQSGIERPQAAAAAAAAGPVAAAGGGMMQVLEGTAQEVFRVLLFLVFTLEVFLISWLPVVGENGGACCSRSVNGSITSSSCRIVRARVSCLCNAVSVMYC
jgi:hypothetical protein